jgi:dTDP-4-dehydrorhamnose reductase
MKGLVVFGRTGQVARELALLAPEAEFIGRDQADLSDPTSCVDAINRASVVINAAAYTSVDQAESEPSLAYAINSATPEAMAKACRERNIPFLHISTDYVFSGAGQAARTEHDRPAPINIYGASKLAGEIAIKNQGGQWAIMRTSWIFSSYGKNFLKTMHHLGANRDEIEVVSDQIGGPTPASDIAVALLKMAHIMSGNTHIGGLYHFSGFPNVSWADFATQIFKKSGQLCKVNRISTSEYPTPAKRPLNSRLDCRHLLSDFNIKQPDWRNGLTRVLEQL